MDDMPSGKELDDKIKLQSLEKEVYLLRKEGDRATRLLCELLSRFPEQKDFDPELKSWWNKHQKVDKKRKAAEDKAKNENKAAIKTQIKKLQKELDALK
jgi:hypothetical protein